MNIIRKFAVVLVAGLLLGAASVASAGSVSLSGTTSNGNPLDYEFVTTEPGHFLIIAQWHVKSSKDLWWFDVRHFQDPSDPWSYDYMCYYEKPYRNYEPWKSATAYGTPGNTTCEFDSNLTGFWRVRVQSGSKVEAVITATHPD